MRETVRERAIGTWRMISLRVGQSGNASEPYGPEPNGLMVLTAEGWFTITIMRPGLPKFASGNREHGTAEENRAVVQNSIAYFGAYTIDEGQARSPAASKARHFQISSARRRSAV